LKINPMILLLIEMCAKRGLNCNLNV